jgi:zinc/manganese transport system ATP-binding protein
MAAPEAGTPPAETASTETASAGTALRAPAAVAPVLELRAAAVRFGERTLWDGLDLDVAPGEFVAVLGPNGSGKTTLVRVLLGLQPLSAGEVRVGGAVPRRGNPTVGYIPQQKALDPDLPLRGRDLVGLGLDGHRCGLGLRGRAARRARVDAALAAVGGTAYADAPVGRISGGEQQRLRVAQALVGDPRVLLCDEPLLSLDLAHQSTVTQLIDERRRAAGTAVLFVTHEINPVLPLVDRVLYLVDGRFRIGPPGEVMTSGVLSELYRTRVDVLRVRGRLVVVGADGADAHCHREEVS